VQVTLQILKALIEKCPRDLPLYAGATLRVFKTILRSLDVTMIEESVPTFATFCANQDPAFLAADQDYIKKFEEIVGLYASLASKDNPVQHKSAKSLPVRIRFRKAGLSAIKAFAESECLSVETGRQLSLIVPAILENIYADSGQYLSELDHLDEEKAELEKEIAIRRRQSTVVAPVDPDQHDTLAASGSIEAADRIAEMETAMIALQALKKTFSVVPRVQLRLATVEVLKFMGERINPIQHFAAETVIPMQSGSWPCMLFGMICGWAPVQDRYVILVTAVDELVRCPLRDEGLQKLYVLATITGWLLSSDINFIGLSVMDVLVGLIHRMLALLPLAPCSTKQNGAANGYAKEEDPELEIHHEFESKIPTVPSKDQILSQLQRCIGCLAVHVYYTDQVADLISAILSRIKPSTSAPPTETGSNADPASSTTSLTRKPSLDGYFSYDNARLAALLSIKEILIWSNWTRPDGSSTSSPRNRVPIDVWEGTHWLLRDEIREVRTAYVEVLLIWMNLELGKADLKFPEPRHHRRTPKKDASEKPKEGILAKRAVSNASHRDLSPPRPKPTFLPLLHVSVYDSALQYAVVETEILLLHLLMSNLVAKLGVNALQHGLPMISRLQEDVNGLEDPASKINVGSLVHGYFLAISVYFHFDASQTGYEVKNEINERGKNGTWLHSVQVPPLQLDAIARRELEAEREQLDAESLQPFVPFEKIPVLVDKISEGYESVLYSPPNSPPNSPIRKLSTPVLDHISVSPPKKSNHFPSQLKELLTSEWSRDGIVSATINTDGSRSGSMSGNSPLTNGSGKHLTVGVAPFATAAAAEQQPSPRRSQYHHLHTHSPLRGSRPASTAHVTHQPHSLREAMLIPSGNGPRSRTSHAGTQQTGSSVRSSVRVEDLKRALSGATPAPGSRGSLVGGGAVAEPEDSTSDSMVSYDESEASASPVVGAVGLGTARMVEGGSLGIAGEDVTTADGSITPRPGTTATAVNVEAASGPRRGSPEPEAAAEIPPVPPVPERFGSLSPPRTVASSSSSAAFQVAPAPAQPPLTATAAESIRSANVRESLRRSISTRDGAGAGPARPDTARTGAGRGQGWSAMDLLESIEAEGLTPPPGSLTRPLVTRLRPPY
jgi:hypothetical protein